ncbi:hypothetical protein Cgig2_000312 [Carnegiea gigantea]|uniref:EF-hand domain-containing protein n=1 Tax=Carnegiea gigantea TaxID=171969 RepID=A0A9Q1GNI3_9CARY|nr:hypothetical protein Cgig2_000312 [Carnegiea gigantea]
MEICSVDSFGGMVSANDPVESLLSSLQVVKDAFSPLESGIKKATQDFEFPWLSTKSGSDNAELLGQVNGPGRSGVNGKNSKVHISALKKKNSPSLSSLNGERKKGSSMKHPIKTILGMFSANCGSADLKVNVQKERECTKGRDCEKEHGSCLNCLQFAMTWSVLLNGFSQAFPSPFKLGKKQRTKVVNEENVPSGYASKSAVSSEFKKLETKKGMFIFMLPTEDVKSDEGKRLSLETLVSLIFDQITQNLQKFDQSVKEKGKNGCDSSSQLPPNPFHFDNWKAISRILEGKKADMNVFLGNLNFARVGGAPSTLVGVTSPVKEDGDDGETATNNEEPGRLSPQKLASGLLSIPLSNVERLKSTLSTVSITELMELVPQLGRSSKDIPDKKKLFSVQDFFRYTEAEVGLTYSAGGGCSVDLVERRRVLRWTKRREGINSNLMKLVVQLGKQLIAFSRYHPWSGILAELSSFATLNLFYDIVLARHRFFCFYGFAEYDLQVLCGINLLNCTGRRFFEELDRDGDGQVNLEDLEIAMKKRKLPRRYAKEFLQRARSHLFANSFGWKQFLSLMEQKEPTILRAYTSLCLSKSGTLKKSEILASLKNAGLPANEDNAVAMMRFLTKDTEGSISYGHFRNFMLLLPSDRLQDDPRNLWFEAATVVPVAPPVEMPAGSVLKSALAGGLASGLSTSLLHPVDTIKVQSLASFCSTLLGTATRIPCEVLKQRLQAGLFDNVGQAIVGTWQQDGLKGFFRGTGVTLCREVPLYVAGMGLYAESKKLAQHLLGRELEPWETIAVGALSGGIAAVITTPFDVLKTRMMTAPHGHRISTRMVAFAILRHEGPLGFFKGALPRFFWVAPLGAMNFAGYELAKKAMIKSDEASSDEIPPKIR